MAKTPIRIVDTDGDWTDDEIENMARSIMGDVEEVRSQKSQGQDGTTTE